MKGNSVDHLQYFLEKLEKREPFSLIRPNDGEYMILQDERFTNIDNWTFSGGSLRSDLDLSIRFAATLPNFYIGIPCPGCWTSEKTSWYIKTYGLDDAHLTYGNIVCNYNWQNLINYLLAKSTPVLYIGPGKENGTPLNVVARFHIDPYLVNNWDTQKNNTITEVDAFIRTNGLDAPYFFSAGPIAKIMITYFAQRYPKGTFIDIGSAFDVFMKGNTNRGYIGQNADLAGLICDFKSGHKSQLGNE